MKHLSPTGQEPITPMQNNSIQISEQKSSTPFICQGVQFCMVCSVYLLHKLFESMIE